MNPPFWPCGSLPERRLVAGLLLEIGQDVEENAGVRITVRLLPTGIKPIAGWQSAPVGVRTVDNRQGHLTKVVQALRSVGRLPDLLHRWDQKADEHGDDGNHHQQFNERKRPHAAKPV